MSATATKLFVSAIALSVSLVSANAQQMNSDFFSGMTTSTESVDEQKEQILRTIEGMMEEVSKLEAPAIAPNSVTIEEIDLQNRQAQRLASELELRQIKFKEMTAQVEMLLALERARKSLTEEGEANQDEKNLILKIQEEDAKSEAEAKKAKLEKDNAVISQEQMSIPRVEIIFGTAGQQEATVISVTGVSQDVVKGDMLADGFQVLDITPKGVLITGMATGKKYYILPSEPTSSPLMDQSQSVDAIDLGASSFPGTF
jgi:hypothetical protein